MLVFFIVLRKYIIDASKNFFFVLSLKQKILGFSMSKNNIDTSSDFLSKEFLPSTFHQMIHH